MSVWGRGPQVPFLDVIIAPRLAHAEPDETGYLPTPCEIGGPGEMVRLLEAAGFSEARERRVVRVVEVPSAHAYLEYVLEGTPIGHSLLEETDDVQCDVLAQTRANLESFGSDWGIRLPAEVTIVTARR